MHYLKDIPLNSSYLCIIHFPISFEKSIKLKGKYSHVIFKFLYIIYYIKGKTEIEVIPPEVQCISRDRLDDDINKRVPMNTTTLKILDPTEIKNIDTFAFIDSQLISINLEDTHVLNLSKYVFLNSVQLESVILPTVLQEIDVSTFKGTKVKILKFNGSSIFGDFNDTLITELHCRNVLYIESITLGNITILNTNPKHILYKNAILYYPRHYEDIDLPNTISTYSFDLMPISINNRNPCSLKELEIIHFMPSIQRCEEHSFYEFKSLKHIHIYSDFTFEVGSFRDCNHIDIHVHGNHHLVMKPFAFERTHYNIYIPKGSNWNPFAL